MDAACAALRRALVILTALALAFGAWLPDLASPHSRQPVYALSTSPAPLLTPILWPATATLANGRVYAAGLGTGSTASLQEYDPVANVWSHRAVPPSGCGGDRMAATTNGRLYTVGTGCTPRQLAEYDPATDTWTLRTAPPTQRVMIAVVGAANGKLYVIGGAIDGVPTGLVEEYDPLTDTWVTRSPMPTPRWGLGLASAANGNVYAVGGGLGPAPALADISLATEEYDPTTDQWTARASMPQGSVQGGVAALTDGRIYVAGGQTFLNGVPVWGNALQRFDPGANTWVLLRPLPDDEYSGQPPGAHGNRQFPGAAATPDGWLLVLGGLFPGGATTSVLGYDPATNSWYPDPVAPTISSVQIQGGATATASASVTLAVVAADVGSGVTGLLLANTSDFAGASWQPFASRVTWTLPPGEGPKTVYARLRDGVGNLSGVAQASILLDATAPTLSGIVVNGGALATTSSTVTVALQAADTSGGSGLAGMAFSNDGGTTWSPWRPFAATSTWTLAAGDGPKTVQARARDAADNVSTSVGDRILLDTVPGTLYGVTIDDAAEWSNTTDVELTIAAPPHTAEMMVSNDGLFGGAVWEPFSTRRPWQLIPFRPNEPITRLVYLRFRDVHGTVANGGTAVIDDIVLDVGAPRAAVSVPPTQPPRAGRGGPRLVWTVNVTADDSDPTAERVSGVTAMRLANRPDFAGAVWQPYAVQVAWDFSGGTTVYAQVRDAAGNVSEAVSTSLPGTTPGPPDTSPAPVCSPRPPVTVRVQPENGSLAVILAATGANNGLRAVRFDSFANAVVDVGDQRNQSAPFAVSIPPGLEPTSLQLTVRRQAPGAAATVRLVVVDGCGEWSTFVGGGPGAF